MKTISVVPGAGVFRSVSAILIISTIVLYFLFKTDDLSRQVELVAMKNRVNEINSALSLVVYNLAIDKNLARLSLLDNQNPFYYLALSQQIPGNYRGVIRNETEMKESGWYYSQSNKTVLYRSKDDVVYGFQLVFGYTDNNQSGAFETENDTITFLTLQERS